MHAPVREESLLKVQFLSCFSRRIPGPGAQAEPSDAAQGGGCAFLDLKGKATVGNYSTVNSAQRLSATLSVRPSGRVQSIDM